MRDPRPRIGALMFLLGWMVFVFAAVPFVYGIDQLRAISVTLALRGAVAMASGGLWVWRAGRPPSRPP